MELTKDKKIESYAKQGLQCTRNTSLPYEINWTCLSCEYNVIKRENDHTKIQRTK